MTDGEVVLGPSRTIDVFTYIPVNVDFLELDTSGISTTVVELMCTLRSVWSRCILCLL